VKAEAGAARIYAGSCGRCGVELDGSKGVGKVDDEGAE